MLTALTREISASIVNCELTHLARAPIDVAIARWQHDEYERCLSALGCVVTRLEADDSMADSVFIEDTAVVVDELAIVMRPGAESRRSETAAVAKALGRHRRVVEIAAPGTIDGGDVLVAGRHVFIGISTRTNQSAADQMEHILAPLGYSVETITVRECLHLKSAVTALGDDVLLLNPEWVDAGRFAGFEVVAVDRSEPSAANAVRVGSAVVFPSAFPLTRQRIERRGYGVFSVDAGELAKAEGAVTCCSIIFPAVSTPSGS
jgi:dimethylargininase